MKPRTIKVIYWVLISIFSLATLFGAIAELAREETGVQVILDLGYPIYLLTILGIAKIIGVISILQWRFKTLKEWAYAGFTIDFIGAAASHMFSGDGINLIINPLIFLVVLFATYFLGKKIGR